MNSILGAWPIVPKENRLPDNCPRGNCPRGKLPPPPPPSFLGKLLCKSIHWFLYDGNFGV